MNFVILFLKVRYPAINYVLGYWRLGGRL